MYTRSVTITTIASFIALNDELKPDIIKLGSCYFCNTTICYPKDPVILDNDITDSYENEKLEEDMNIMESMLKYTVDYVLKNCREELEFLDNFVEKGLIKKLEDLVAKKAIRITHHDAIKYLIESGKKFEFEPQYGEDLAREHEKYLTEEKFNAPVFVYDWPKDIKAFYMRLNDDKATVAAVDLLVPGSGELMGGSQREERYDVLETRMKEMNVSTEELNWYLNLRKYGGCVHSGFGMGFERLIMYLTGIENIRDVIPYPRTPGNCEF